MNVTRRSLPLLFAVPALKPARAAAAAVRVGMLRFGSLSWELDVMRTHGFDTAAGISVVPVEFAANQATQVALQAGQVDAIVQDWLWVSRQRGSGADWTFAPGSAALGAVMTPAGSAVGSMADLVGKRLGVAGSPLDKSWLILRGFCQKTMGFDIDAKAEKTFGPPPLLAQQLAAGRLDAMLTFWPFAARAEAEGLRTVLNMADALAGLGISTGLPMLGYVFAESWATRERDATVGFLAASQQARRLLGTSDGEWDRIAKLTGARDETELAQLRIWYRRGLPQDGAAREQNEAAKLYDILAAIGGADLVGAAAHLAPGTFWHAG